MYIGTSIVTPNATERFETSDIGTFADVGIITEPEPLAVKFETTTPVVSISTTDSAAAVKLDGTSPFI